MQDYFAFFELPPSPVLDVADLKRKFYANSKRFHPDFHTLADPATQEDVLEKSTLNNQAYKVLSDPDLRLRHFLEVKQALGDEGTNTVPQDFLLEVMEINEALMELEFDDDPVVRRKVIALVDGLEAELVDDVAEALRDYDDEKTNPRELELLRDYYLKRRYLKRIKEKI